MFVRRSEFNELKRKVERIDENLGNYNVKRIGQELFDETASGNWFPSGGNPTLKGRVIAIEKHLGVQVVPQEAENKAIKKGKK